ncbi:ammonia-forming cytochrome c nitrite reductase subunit c552 [Dethiobacter alkaliphilus]|uniref:nitrite reductase (cytochrome; ammonia-forming) n=1 Tax=Dethiobacter alkaliphilus AHT 1 TaxID=555088 RepID=C0GK63_DETAL|nr:ammonia-forming cytochrome c nitrite reductase subunit c552 [Dethiobacter alkaliphilus]EEG76246.1 Nitrite reductase (cytochrome; ammonia-forming) [Dethiobacter alkaliphilus AHT 1]
MKKGNEKHWIWVPLGALAALFAAAKARSTEKHRPAHSGACKHRWLWPMIFVALSLFAGIAGGVLITRQYYQRHVLPSRPTVQWQIAENEVNPANWGQWFPDHYQSYLEGLEHAGEPPQKIKLRPALEILWAGYDAAPSIREHRGHPYSLDDVTREAPLRNNQAGCLTCKAAEAPLLLEQMGTDFYKKSFSEMREDVQHPVSCSACHDPETMGLRLSREPFIQAYVRAGGDLKNAGRQEMRSLVCAQCHITYYLDKESGEVNIPWTEEPNISNVEHYYLALSEYRTWEHALTGAEIPKLRHPDYEFFLGSTHHDAGVSCADCHMPFMIKGDRKMTSHSFESPLETPLASCGVCHRESEEYLVQRIERIQADVSGVLSVVEDELVQAVQMVEELRQKPDADPEDIRIAQELHLRAFLHYDWVFAANSMGFHNSREALIILSEAMRLAKEVQLVVLQAGL